MSFHLFLLQGAMGLNFNQVRLTLCLSTIHNKSIRFATSKVPSLPDPMSIYPRGPLALNNVLQACPFARLISKIVGPSIHVSSYVGPSSTWVHLQRRSTIQSMSILLISFIELAIVIIRSLCLDSCKVLSIYLSFFK